MSERKIVQEQLIKYARQIGWTYLRIYEEVAFRKLD